MRDTILILLCAVALAQGDDTTAGQDPRTCNCDPSEAQRICRTNNGNDNVLIAHEYCNKFYKCSNGVPYPYKCASNLLYDPYKEVCLWPHLVECGDRPIAENDDESNGTDNDNVSSLPPIDIDSCNCDPSKAPSICAAEGSDGTLVAHESCNKFYKCAWSVPVVFRCANGLLYNPYKEQCDYDNNVKCGDRIIPPPEDVDIDNGSTNNTGAGNWDPSEAPKICAAPESESILIAHENCNQYYICSGGKPVTMSCLPNLFFDPDTDRCEWATNVDCGDRIIPDRDCNCTNNDNGNEDNLNNDCDNDGNDNNNNGNDSGSSNEGGYNGNDNGSENNVDTNDNSGNNNSSSDNDNVVNDNNSNFDNVDTDGGNSDPNEAPSICAAPESDDILVAHENCNQFYKCANGKPIVLKCPNNLLFNPETDKCDWPKNVNCGNRIIPDPEDENNSIDSSGSDNDCNGNGEDNCSSGNDNGGNDNDDNNNDGTCNCNPDEAPSICKGEGSDGVLVAHEDCNKFYKCAHGIPIVLRCPPKTLFNPYKRICDWASKVDCGDREIPDPDDDESNESSGNDNDCSGNGDDNCTSENDIGGNDNDGTCNCNPDEAPSICKGEGSDGVLVAHEDCNKFYKCAHGIPIVLRCPPKTLFNPYKRICDWASKVDCGDREIPDPDDDESNESSGNDKDCSGNGDDNCSSSNDNGGNDNDGTCNCNPDEAPAICKGVGSDGVLVAHEDCNKFYKCVHGIPIVLRCPPKTLFNPYKRICDWASKVDCGDREIPDPEDDESNESSGNDNDCSGNGDDNCTSENDIGGNDNDGTCNCNPDEAPSICKGEGSDGVLVAHEDCNKFYKCAHGIPIVLRCPPKTLFNPYKRICDWASKVDCGDREIPDPADDESNESSGNGNDCNGNDDDNCSSSNDNGGNDNDGTCNCNPDEAPAICKGEGSDGVLVAHEDCNKFYKCAHGIPIVLRCPPKTLFNPYKRICDWASKVDCGDREIPDPADDESNESSGNGNDCNGNDDDNCSSSNDNGGNDNDGTCNCNPDEAPAICKGEGSDGVLVAHEDCNKFYKCAHGIPIVLRCPPKTLFNPYKRICDWASKVDCGDREIPDPDDDESNESSGNDNDCSGNGDDNCSSSNDNGGNDNDGTCNCNPDEAPAICKGVGSDGVLVAHEDCNKFYKCAHGIPIVLRCPPKTLFNPYKRICDWASKVDCGDREIPDPDDDESNESSSNDNDCSGNGDDNCTSENDIGGNDNDGTCNCNPDEAPSICKGEGSDGVLVAHEDCNKFYKCAHGIPIVLRCPPKTLFNPYKRICDWASKVDCGDREIPDPDDDESNESSSNDNDCSGNGDDNCTSENDIGGNDNDGTCNCNPDEAPSICKGEGSDGVLVAHEDCNKFYKCAHGIPIVLRCPPKTLFNPYKRICDWASKVDCGDREIPDPADDESNESSGNGNDCNGNDDDNCSSSNDNGGNDNDGTCNCNPDEAPAICKGEGSDGVLVAHEDCNKFYKCAHGIPIVLRCPPKTLFNPYKRICDWASKVDCGDREIPDPDDDESNESSGNDNDCSGNGDDNCTSENDIGGNDDDGTCNCNPDEAPSICKGEGSDGVLVAHEDCNKFYKCAHGIPIVLRCPPKTLFNPYKRICDWASKVDCGDREIPDPDDDESNESSGNDNDCSGNGDDNCTSENDIGGNDNDGTCNCNPDEAPAICKGEGSDGVLVAHEDCNKFYKCAHGIPIVLRCPPKTLFNPYKRICDWASKVDCGDREIPDPDDDESNESSGNDNDCSGNGDDNCTNENDIGGSDNDGTCNCNPDEAPSICKGEGSNGVLVAHEDCNKFYKCAHGLPIVLRCPPKTLFNPYKRICDWASKVDCGDREIPDPADDESNESSGNGNDCNGNDDDNCSSSNDNGGNDNDGTCNCNPDEAPAICKGEGSDGVLVAHEDCNKFYKCAHGIPIVLRCPPKTLFNPYKRICDWATKVECGDRVIPELGDNEDSSNSSDIDNNLGNDSEDNMDSNFGNDSEGDNDTNSENDNNSNGNEISDNDSDGDIDDNLGNDSAGENNSNNGNDNDNNDNKDGDNNGNDNDINNNNVDDSDCDQNNNENNGTCNCNPDEAPLICAGENSNGVLIAHESCNKFYQCSYGTPVEFKCNGILLYNPIKEICDWPSNVDCDGRPIDPDDNEDNTSNNSEDDNNESNENEGPCNCNPEEAPSICAKVGSDGVLIAHENCNQFYMCTNGIPVALTCSPQTLYNPYIQRCDWESKVTCGDRVIPESKEEEDNDSSDIEDEDDNNHNVNDDPSQAPAICAESSSSGVLVAHENCNQFYQCSGGLPIAMNCSGDLLFNPVVRHCDWPRNVDCGDRIIPGGGDDCACNPRSAPSFCAKENSEGKFTAHENCNQFYVCVHGLPQPRHCAPSLFYNIERKECDWPQNVDCSSRSILSPSLNKHLESRHKMRK